MEWKCPHCQVELSVADGKLPEDWFFSKCTYCAGYAVIRKAAVKPVNLSDTPQIENFSQAPKAMPRLPIIEEHYREQQYQAQQHPDQRQREERPYRRESQQPKPQKFPDPLPEPKEAKPLLVSLAEKISKAKIQPGQVALAASCTVALASAFYFYTQAGKLSHYSKSVQKTSAAPEMDPVLSPPPSLRQMKVAHHEAPAETQEIRDEVTHQAMAPDRNTMEENTFVAADDLIPHERITEPKPMQQSASPKRTQVKTPYRRALLRQGPSKSFEIIGIADPSVVYNVVGGRDNWFRIQDPAGKIAWIRNDLVVMSN